MESGNRCSLRLINQNNNMNIQQNFLFLLRERLRSLDAHLLRAVISLRKCSDDIKEIKLVEYSNLAI